MWDFWHIAWEACRNEMHLVWRGEIKFLVFFFKLFFHACKHSISPGRDVDRDRRLIGKTGLGPKEIKSPLVLPVAPSDFTCMSQRGGFVPNSFPRGPAPGGAGVIYGLNPPGHRHTVILSRQGSCNHLLSVNPWQGNTIVTDSSFLLLSATSPCGWQWGVRDELMLRRDVFTGRWLGRIDVGRGQGNREPFFCLLLSLGPKTAEHRCVCLLGGLIISW